MEFMNLTKTKRWSEFVDWYDNQNFLYSIRSNSDNIPDFEELDFEFQEGVYRKFIESNNILRVNDEYEEAYWLPGISERFRTFQELVEWFFTNS